MKTIADSSQLPCLMLPIDRNLLLVPNNCVAEVVNSGLASAIASSVTLGTLQWRDNEVPIVSVEGMLGRTLPRDYQFKQAAIVIGLSAPERLPYFAIALAGMPRLRNLSPAEVGLLDISKSGSAGEKEDVIQSRVQVDGIEMLVPDWEYLERQILQTLYGDGSWSEDGDSVEDQSPEGQSIENLSDSAENKDH
ncbi:hypothetical protein IB286_00065 [Spongiibacter sp. KMU-158]|uniref:CheW-like domain-containing protein n=1 Tax=Spongiibacter pelagi TaxID=2760804 RepID=A0A927BYI3_9GAMM|nr:hypothetical protein [Spongiibacter pelagi]MBD2857379.1 hypothetical protein [Spongiibacter pelagi]